MNWKLPGKLWIATMLMVVTGCSAGGTGNTNPNRDGSTGMDMISTMGDSRPIDGDPPRFDIVQREVVMGPDVVPNPDAFFANDPPPQFCGPDGGMGPPPVVPGGTPECPDDKNREGCPCPIEMLGQQAPCWPGLRVNRDRGVCHDGVTTCREGDEFFGRWGPCENYQLPTTGARLGPEACQCFSAGRWQIDNLSPCFVTYGTNVYAVSTFIDSMGNAQCPRNITPTPPPAPEPNTNWSTNSLTVDCSGRFNLCYTIKAGNSNAPSATDCEVARACSTAWYDQPNVTQQLPPLPAWTSTNTACATQFMNNGGYGEMSVVGISAECEQINDNNQPYVFLRVGYCPVRCNTTPSLPECQNCSNGGSGNF